MRGSISGSGHVSRGVHVSGGQSGALHAALGAHSFVTICTQQVLCSAAATLSQSDTIDLDFSISNKREGFDSRE